MIYKLKELAQLVLGDTHPGIIRDFVEENDLQEHPIPNKEQAAKLVWGEICEKFNAMNYTEFLEFLLEGGEFYAADKVFLRFATRNLEHNKYLMLELLTRSSSAQFCFDGLGRAFAFSAAGEAIFRHVVDILNKMNYRNFHRKLLDRQKAGENNVFFLSYACYMMDRYKWVMLQAILFNQPLPKPHVPRRTFASLTAGPQPKSAKFQTDTIELKKIAKALNDKKTLRSLDYISWQF